MPEGSWDYEPVETVVDSVTCELALETARACRDLIAAVERIEVEITRRRELSDGSDRSDGAGAGQEKRVSPATQISTEQKKHFLAAINGEDEIQPRRVFSAEEPKEEKENVKPVNPY